MDDGLIQFLVIGLFVVISMMEGATRKKRRQGKALQRPAETEVDFVRSLTGDEEGESETSDGLVPHEIWAEIAELARGETPDTLDRASAPEPMRTRDTGVSHVARPIPQVGDRFEERSSRLPVSGRGGRVDHEVLAEGREFAEGTPHRPTSLVKARSRPVAREAAVAAVDAVSHKDKHSVGLADLEEDELYALSAGRSSTMLRFFGERGGRSGELRRAIILSEILGPPVSLREERDW
ncbi:MAG: hypothetical protein BMS9Abin29_2366 [Gemmatimonadota bacterium]|nr:MAG: hypothetical protein BMS9Abin29_2366 [Gemmatimonadota bacterium]